MKRITLLFGAILIVFALQSNAQVLFQSDFETWNAGVPDGWNGSATNIGPTNFVEYTTSAASGSKACQLINTSTSHKRFTTSDLSITSGQSYKVRFWVRGQGQIRTGLYNGGTGYAYQPYLPINSTTWTAYEQIVSSDATATNGQIIFSLHTTDATNDHIQIDSVTVTYFSDFDTLSIYDIQYSTSTPANSPVMDQTVVTYGIVTAFRSGGFFIQDGVGEWNGLYIFNGTYPVALGDSIMIKGKISEYYEMTEMTNVSLVDILGSNATIPAPAIITTAMVNTEAYESVLVKVINAECTNPAAGYGMWAINDGSGIAKVDTMFYTYTPTLGTHYNVTGPIMYSFDEFRIEPRNAADVELWTSIGETEVTNISVYPNPASSFVRINAEGFSKVSIINIVGQTMYEGNNFNEVTLDVTTWPAGMYLVNFYDVNGNTLSRKLIVE